MTQNQTQTEPLFAQDNLNTLVLRNRPSIRDIWPEIFDVLPESSLICIEGGNGKSKIAHEMMAKVLSMNEGVGKAEVLFIEICQHFRILKFANTCSKYFFNPSHEFMKSLLDKLTVQEIRSPHAADFIVTEIENELNDNQNISMVVIDCFGFFYYHASWIHGKVNKEKLTKDNFFTSFLDQFKALSNKFKVTFVYTKPIYMETENEENISDIVIEIEAGKGEDRSKMMEIKCSITGKIKRAKFWIESNGIRIESVEEVLVDDEDLNVTVNDEFSSHDDDDNDYERDFEGFCDD